MIRYFYLLYRHCFLNKIFVWIILQYYFFFDIYYRYVGDTLIRLRNILCCIFIFWIFYVCIFFGFIDFFLNCNMFHSAIESYEYIFFVFFLVQCFGFVRKGCDEKSGTILLGYSFSSDFFYLSWFALIIWSSFNIFFLFCNTKKNYFLLFIFPSSSKK